MPTQEYAASIQGVSIRVTRLDAAGNLQTGPGDSYTTSAFMRLSFTPEYEEGDEITEKGANGAVCVTFKSPDTLKRITMELAICEPDPELSALLSGGLLLRKNVGTFASANNLSVGWASPGVGDDPAGFGVAIEAWSWAVKDGKRASARPYFHWVFPFVKLRQSGDRVIENGVLANTFQGYGLGNANFASGIDGRWEFPTATERPYAYARNSWAPVGLNGFYTWNYAGEGGAELGTPNYAAVDSLDGVNFKVSNTAMATDGTITLTTSATHTYVIGDSISVAGADRTVLITNKAATTSQVTLTTSAAHSLVVGDRITVSIGDSAFDGTYACASGTTGSTIVYNKTNGAAVTSVAVNSGSAVATVNVFNGTYTAVSPTSGTTITYKRTLTGLAGTLASTTGTYTKANHGLVTGQTVTITGFAKTTLNISNVAITVTDANTFTATVTAGVDGVDANTGTLVVTRSSAITSAAAPFAASASSATAGTSATTGYNVPGNLSFNADNPVDRVIRSNEDPTS